VAFKNAMRRLPPPVYGPLAVLVFIGALGGQHFALQWQQWQVYQEWFAAYPQVYAEGQIVLGAGSRVLLDADFVCASGGQPCLQQGRMRLWLTPGGDTPPPAGQVQITAKFLTARPARTPGGFDERFYALRNNVVGTLRVDTVQSAQSVRGALTTQTWRNAWRTWLTGEIAGEPGAVAAAITLGDTSQMSQTTKDLFSRSGLAHLTSVSGMHVGILLSAVWFLLRGRYGWRSFVGILVAGLFTMLVGSRPSAVRAFVAAGACVAAQALGVKPEPWTVLAAALVFILVGNPALVSDWGLVLSFAAMAGIFLITRPLTPRRSKAVGLGPKLWRWLQQMFFLTLGAQAGTAIFVASYFNTIQLLGFPATLMGSPLAMLVLLFGMGGCVLHSLHVDILARVCVVVVEFSAKALLATADYLGNLPWAVVVVGSPAPAGVFAWWFCVVGVALWLQSRSLPKMWRQSGYVTAWRWCLAGVLIFSILLCQQVYSERLLRITFINVGEGDAILIQAPFGRTVLVDAGDRSSTAVPGKEVLAQLRRLGVHNLAAAVSTHPHSDHLGGMSTVLMEIPVATVWETGAKADTQTYTLFRQALAETGTERRLAYRGDTLQLGEVKITVLWPPHPAVWQVAGSSMLNDLSIVLHVVYGRIGVLLMADAGGNIQQYLQHAALPSPVTIWKVPHQGAKTCCSTDFMAAIRPAAAVVSVGPNNYGHPDPGVMKQLSAAGPVCRTDVHGNVTFVSNGQWWRLRGVRGHGCNNGAR